MFLNLLELPFFIQTAVFGVILMGVIKVYLYISLGVCKSKTKLNGKTVIVTGANTGIGKETALDLAKRNARVILACRDLKKATEAKKIIIEESGNKDVVVMELDLASFASVRKFAAQFLKNESRLDILINNAGCAAIAKKLSMDGIEHQMQTNHFGHFLLTNLLLGLMIKTSKMQQENVRIINVSSEANRLCRSLNFEDLNFERDSYAGTYWSPFKIYGASKLCNILFTIELANKLKSLGDNNKITVNSLHPGAVYTEFGRFSKVFNTSMKFFATFLKTPKEGAQTTIFLAVADEVTFITGKYFCDCKIANPSNFANDAGVAKKLWEVSETLVKLRPDEKYF